MVLATLLVVSAGIVQAADVTVGCEGAGKGPFKYSSISDALTALYAISYRDHTITVSGTCTEFVQIRDFENLRLIGTAGTAIVADTPRSVLSVNASKSIFIEGLALRGYGRRVNLVSISDSTVTVTLNHATNQLHGLGYKTQLAKISVNP